MRSFIFVDVLPSIIPSYFMVVRVCPHLPKKELAPQVLELHMTLGLLKGGPICRIGHKTSPWGYWHISPTKMECLASLCFAETCPCSMEVSVGACSPRGGGGEGVPEASCSWVDDASTLASVGFSSGLCHLGDTLFLEVWPLLWTSLLSISSVETGQNI